MVRETFSPARPLASGRVNLTFAVAVSRVGRPRRHAAAYRLRLSGPFQQTGGATLPSFDLKVSVRASGQRQRVVRAQLTSSRGKLFVGLAGREFVAPAGTVQALRRGYLKAAAGAAPNGASPGAVRLDPSGWLLHPRTAGSRRLAGTETIHVVAGLNVARFLSDTRALAAAGPLAGVGQGGAETLPRELSAAPPAAVRVARVDLYTGASDRLPRRLVIHLAVAGAAAAPGDLRSARVVLTVDLRALNRPQQIATPASARPASELGPLLQRLGLAPSPGSSR